VVEVLNSPSLEDAFVVFSPSEKENNAMKIKLSSVMVDDQDKALKFYTEILGFVKKTDLPVGEYKWLTVVSPEGPEDIELVLEPMGFEPAKTYQKALFDAGIPITALATDNIQNDYKRMKELGVVFRGEPQKMGDITVTLFEDTCGNIINLYQAEI
jgi:catechol 2,3-dioxygenase-like lactoylglutathione lyase family enzyme